MKHKCRRRIPFIMGRAKCKKHDLVYHISFPDQMCPKCAREKGICPKCKEPIDGQDK